MSKSFGKWLMDIQTWVITHVNQLYLWASIIGVLCYGLVYYNSAHHIPLLQYNMILIFMIYASWKIIIR